MAADAPYSSGWYYTNVSTRRLFQTIVYVARQSYKLDMSDDPSMRAQVLDDQDEVEMTITVSALRVQLSGGMAEFGSQYNVDARWFGAKKAKPQIRKAKTEAATHTFQSRIERLLFKITYPSSGELRTQLVGREGLASVVLPVWVSPEGEGKSPPGAIVKPGEKATVTNVLFCRQYPGEGCNEQSTDALALVVFLNGSQPRPDISGALQIYQAQMRVYSATLKVQTLMDPGPLEEMRTKGNADKEEADFNETASQYNHGGPEIAISLEAVGDWTPGDGLTVSPDKVLLRLADLLRIRGANSQTGPGDSTYVQTSEKAIPDGAIVSVKSTPDGADIVVEGKFFGNTPSTLHLPPGDCVIVVRKSGFKLWQRTVTITQGGNVTLDVILEKSQ
jgi:hypothetical protein